VQEAALYVAHKRGTHPRDNRKVLAELVGLKGCLTKAEPDRANEAGELVALLLSMSNTLMDLGLDPIQ
jgi:hypothetical protein